MGLGLNWAFCCSLSMKFSLPGTEETQYGTERSFVPTNRTNHDQDVPVLYHVASFTSTSNWLRCIESLRAEEHRPQSIFSKSFRFMHPLQLLKLCYFSKPILDFSESRKKYCILWKVHFSYQPIKLIRLSVALSVASCKLGFFLSLLKMSVTMIKKSKIHLKYGIIITPSQWFTCLMHINMT